MRRFLSFSPLYLSRSWQFLQHQRDHFQTITRAVIRAQEEYMVNSILSTHPKLSPIFLDFYLILHRPLNGINRVNNTFRFVYNIYTEYIFMRNWSQVLKLYWLKERAYIMIQYIPRASIKMCPFKNAITRLFFNIFQFAFDECWIRSRSDSVPIFLNCASTFLSWCI